MLLGAVPARARWAGTVAHSGPMGNTTVTLVPHTHWDREWYEPFSVFSERLVEMMDALLDLGAEGSRTSTSTVRPR